MAACPTCGHDNEGGARFCSSCGTALEPGITPPREVRKTVTVLFCDVTGSTELGERLDPESLRAVMSRYFDRMRAVIESHGGKVEKFIGDAVMAVFGIPTAHEDDAVRAVRAAVDMRAALAELHVELEHERGVGIAARIGINTGDVVTGDPASGQALVTGDAVNTAARLEQAAAPGEILIGELTQGLVRDAVEAEPVDPLALKGKAAAVGAFRLLTVRSGVAGHERRLDSPMVGRERQLRILLDAFDGARADATCYLFTVLGSAGIGKSRLVREFASRVADRATVLTGRCLSYGEGITFWPVAEMAIQAAGIAEEDPPDRARLALRGTLEGAPDADVVAAHLAGLMGLDGQGPVEAPWAVRRFLETIAVRRPLVAVFDDIHWAEPTLLDVIEHVADRARDAPILLLCMARPELLEERPAWAGGMRNAASVHLEPLSEQEADRLIENLLGHPALTPEIRERVRAAAQGNPLFVEEMLEMLLDDGVLVRKDGEWVATVDLTSIEVPPAISALLAARLDRLTAAERAALEAGAVIGEVFEGSSVRSLLPEAARPAADAMLSSLIRKDLLRPSRSDVGGGDAFRFRHLLLRDAAYEGIPKAQRAELHQAFADLLEATYSGREAEFDEFIGYHLERATVLREDLGLRDERTSALARQASERLAAAGRRAFQRNDMAAASNLLGRGSSLLPPDDPDRHLLAWELGYALVESGALSEAARLLEETAAGAESNGHEVAAAYARCILMYARIFADPSATADAWDAETERLVAYFDRVGELRGAAIARAFRAYSEWFRERIQASAEAAEHALEAARTAGDRQLETELLGHLLACRVTGPTPISRAIAEAERTLDEARARGDRILEASALRHLGVLAAMRGDFGDARVNVTAGRGILLELGRTIDYWATAQAVARIRWKAGELDAAAQELRASVEELERLGETAFLSTCVAMLAAIEAERGELGEAERWVRVAERTGSPDDRATRIVVELARGVMAAGSDPASAESHLRRALQLGDDTDVTEWRIEPRQRLAHLLATSRPDEAIALLHDALALAEVKEATAAIEECGRSLAELERR